MSSKGDPELPPIVDALWQIAGITNDDDLFSDTEVSTPKGASVSVLWRKIWPWLMRFTANIGSSSTTLRISSFSGVCVCPDSL